MADSEETRDLSQQILSRLSKIEHKIDSIEQTSAFALRADEAKHQGSVKEIFKNSIRKAQIYLAADGARGVQEIADFLRMKRQNVGPALKELVEEGLLESNGGSGGRDVCSKKPLDKSLRITRFLMKEFSLASDGKEKPRQLKKKGSTKSSGKPVRNKK